MMTSRNFDLDRRGFLGAIGATTATLATSGLAQAQTGAAAASATAAVDGEVITREIGRTGKRMTALGLGTFLTFDLQPGASRENIRQVFRLYAAGGGRVVDTSPLYGSAETSVGAFLSESPAHPRSRG